MMENIGWAGDGGQGSDRRCGRLRMLLELLVTTLSLILLNFLFAGAASAGDAPKLQQLVFANTDPSVSLSVAPMTSLPVALGFWKEEGLDVVVQPVSGGNAAVQAISVGNAFMTETGMTSIYPGVLKDPNMRLTMVRNGIYSVVVPADSDIHSAADLKGKVIGVQSLSAASYFYGRAVVRTAGLNPDDDVKWVPVGIGFQAAAAQQNGTINAYAGYDGINAKFGQLLQKKLHIIPTPLSEMPGMIGWLVSKQSVDKSPRAVVGMLRGILKSMVWAKANPEAAVRVHWKVYPDSKPTNVSDDVAMKNALEVLNNRVDHVYLPDGLNEKVIGAADPAKVQETADFLFKNGFLKKSIHVADYMDTALIKEANNFDRQKIIEQAKNYKFDK